MRMSIEKAHIKHLTKTEKLYADQLRQELAGIESVNKKHIDELAYDGAIQSIPQSADEPPQEASKWSHETVLPKIRLMEVVGPKSPELLGMRTGSQTSLNLRPKSSSKYSRRNSKSVLFISPEVIANKTLELEELCSIAANPTAFIASLGNQGHMALCVVERSVAHAIQQLKVLSDYNDSKQRALRQIYTHFAWKKDYLSQILKNRTEEPQTEDTQEDEGLSVAAGPQPSVQLPQKSDKELGTIDFTKQVDRNRQLWLIYLNSKLILGRFGLSVQAINSLKADIIISSGLKDLTDTVCREFYGTHGVSLMEDVEGVNKTNEHSTQSRLVLDNVEASSHLHKTYETWMLKETMMIAEAQTHSEAFLGIEMKTAEAFDRILQLLRQVREESQRRKVQLYMLTGKSESTSKAVMSLKTITRKVRVIPEGTELTHQQVEEETEESQFGTAAGEDPKTGLETTALSGLSRQSPMQESRLDEDTTVYSTRRASVEARQSQGSSFFWGKKGPGQPNRSSNASSPAKAKVSFAEGLFNRKKPSQDTKRAEKLLFKQISLFGEVAPKKSAAKEKILEKATERLANDLNSFSPAAQRAKGFKLLLKDYFQRIRGMKEEPNFNFKNLEPVTQGSDVKGLHRERVNSSQSVSEARGQESRGNSADYRITSFRKGARPGTSLNTLSLSTSALKDYHESYKTEAEAKQPFAMRRGGLRLSLNRVKPKEDKDTVHYLFSDTAEKPNREGLLPIASSKLLKKQNKTQDQSLLVRKPQHRTVLQFAKRAE